MRARTRSAGSYIVLLTCGKNLDRKAVRVPRSNPNGMGRWRPLLKAAERFDTLGDEGDNRLVSAPRSVWRNEAGRTVAFDAARIAAGPLRGHLGVVGDQPHAAQDPRGGVLPLSARGLQTRDRGPRGGPAHRAALAVV